MVRESAARNAGASPPRRGSATGFHPVRIFMVAAATFGLMIGAAAVANAYALTGNKWFHSSYHYCMLSSVTGHSNWANLIGKDVAQYNALRYANQPTWGSKCSDENYRIKFEQIRMDSSLCGHTDMGHSMGIMITAEVEYSSTHNFYDTSTNQSSNSNCSFQWVTLHEFGHSQGLAHSSDTSAVMTPRDNNKRVLQPDDKRGLKAIYG